MNPLTYEDRRKLIFTSTQPRKKEAAATTEAPDKVAIIKQITIENLGVPDELIKIDVKQLWDSLHFRVNVWIGLNDKKVGHSYFVEVGDELTFSPPIENIYN